MDNQPTPAQQELAITGVLNSRLVKEDCLRPGDRETVAYRVAEIMVQAKALYTDVLPRLMQEGGPSEYTAFDDLSGLRMALLHLRDLIEDFDEAFMEAMANQREEEGTESPEWLSDD